MENLLYFANIKFTCTHLFIDIIVVGLPVLERQKAPDEMNGRSPLTDRDEPYVLLLQEF